MRTLLLFGFFVAIPFASAQTVCPQDTYRCPDGSTYVHRDAANECRFFDCPEIDPNFAQYFYDVRNEHVNANAVRYVKTEGIVEGYADGSFRPDQTINRAEFTKIISNASLGDRQYAQEFWMCSEGEAGPGAMAELQSRNPFKDIDVNDWYAFPICIALKASYIQGYSDGTFRPGNPINFVEAAKIIAKAFGLEATTTIPACEADCPWYRSPVLMLEAHAAIPASIVSFNQSITRGEMAEMIYRLSTGNTDKPSATYEGLQSPDQSIAPNVFDENAVQVGQRVGQMTVVSVVHDTGVDFVGSVTVTGRYRVPPENFEGMGSSSVCMWQFDADSILKLPIYASDRSDSQHTSFCFDPSDELYRHFPRGTQGTATVTINRYHKNLIGAEIWDSAGWTEIIAVYPD